MSTTQSINPYTEKVIQSYDRLSINEAKNKLEIADNTFHIWKKKSIEERAKLLNNLAKILEKNKDKYALIATQEMGKLYKQSVAEIEKCAWVCRFYAEKASSFLADEIVETKASKSYITYQPIGTILAVMPWNFPFYQVVRFIAPTIMAGNVGVLKHASNVQGCAFALESAFKEAGFEEGCFTNLNIVTGDVQAIIEHKSVAAVTLTGSEYAGKAVAKIAGENIKKSVLELGGSDAYIILEDCDLEYTVERCVYGRLQNNGQTCIAAKRFIVVEEIYDQFLTLFTQKMQELTMGDPMDDESYYGPMARTDLRDELHEQVQKSISQGSKLHLGGKIPKRTGAFYPATILTNVKPGMEAFDNELFGPVASVIKATNEDKAIELTNNSKFGLGSGVFTSDNKRGERVALQLEAGNSFVNTLTISDPNMPFGGIKTSGYGRELSKNGIREFTNTKSIWIK